MVAIEMNGNRLCSSKNDVFDVFDVYRFIQMCRCADDLHGPAATVLLGLAATVHVSRGCLPHPRWLTSSRVVVPKILRILVIQLEIHGIPALNQRSYVKERRCGFCSHCSNI